MARYIEANDLVRKMTLQANRSSLGEIAPPSLSYSEMLEIIADAPTADVVPRVDLDAMRSAANSYKMHYNNLAREIFEEIEKLTICRMIPDVALIDDRLITDIAELKKKYLPIDNESEGTDG